MAPTLQRGFSSRGLANRLDSVSHDYESKPFGELVEMYRSGPPAWNPMRLADKYANLAENFIHHEDVRRGGGEGTPRDLPQSARDDLWNAVKMMAKFFLRSSTIHVVLERTDAATPTVARAGADSSSDEVRVKGGSGELLLWLYGRDSVAEVTLTPEDPATVDRIGRHVF
ncbi:TIGR03085 family metal-binding protein [Corynebacterium macclintockiae]|uniref:TIGR03085 family metal-binding protein n=1 Tax=Corynebacterium macclintockiae TaxID=2913501 RepID=UPI003EBF6284